MDRKYGPGRCHKVFPQSGWYLRQFLNDGNIPIDNGATERVISPAAVGRRNWLFFGTVNGAQCGAMQRM